MRLFVCCLLLRYIDCLLFVKTEIVLLQRFLAGWPAIGNVVYCKVVEWTFTSSKSDFINKTSLKIIFDSLKDTSEYIALKERVWQFAYKLVSYKNTCNVTKSWGMKLDCIDVASGCILNSHCKRLPVVVVPLRGVVVD